MGWHHWSACAHRQMLLSPILLPEVLLIVSSLAVASSLLRIPSCTCHACYCWALFFQFWHLLVHALSTFSLPESQIGSNRGCGLTVDSKTLHGFGLISFFLLYYSSSLPSGKPKQSITASSTFTGSSWKPAASAKRISVEYCQYLFSCSISQAALHGKNLMQRQKTGRWISLRDIGMKPDCKLL